MKRKNIISRIFSFGLLVALIILSAIYYQLMSNKIKGVIDEGQSNIGKNFILKGDTLKIVDYSFMDETYTLENGLIISVKMINKQ
jgi:hypothetical protein